ncbi:hypothetical protein CI238_10525 [Colletotrichum incanum]|uniref:Uncharacterized protein n=1 Tax=Colletotrichum incanum TaxID=1573173 RepID=A0A167E5Y7_COLIC|nr:hypothetical protein CI238_10525 [Colletotrichum incanum]OHW98959.1 hypothetical protein CSPAE12_02348 [Colletotrichum incanum]
MHLSAPTLLAFFLTIALALPTAKDAKFFTPSASDPSVQDLGQKTGKIGIDIVDPNALRVDPVRVLDKIAQSSSHVPSLTKRRNVLLEEEDGKITKRSHIQVDPVEVDVHVVRPSPHVVPANSPQLQAEVDQKPGETGRKEEEPEAPNAKYIPKFRLKYDTGEWVRHY